MSSSYSTVDETNLEQRESRNSDLVHFVIKNGNYFEKNGLKMAKSPTDYNKSGNEPWYFR